jgi:hypothetical protein
MAFVEAIAAYAEKSVPAGIAAASMVEDPKR